MNYTAIKMNLKTKEGDTASTKQTVNNTVIAKGLTVYENVLSGFSPLILVPFL